MGIKGSFDDQGRLFSYFNWLTSLVFSWPLSLIYVPTSKSKVFFKDLDPDHAQTLDANLSMSGRAARPAGL